MCSSTAQHTAKAAKLQAGTHLIGSRRKEHDRVATAVLGRVKSVQYVGAGEPGHYHVTPLWFVTEVRRIPPIHGLVPVVH